MYRLLSTQVLALMNYLVISIERYIVLQPRFLPLCLASSDPVSQCSDLYCGHLAQICTSLTKCFMLGIRLSAMNELFTLTTTNNNN